MSNPGKNETLRQEIERRAYLRFCDRAGAHGFDVEDWLAAERDVLAEVKTEEPKRSTQLKPLRRRTGGNRR